VSAREGSFEGRVVLLAGLRAELAVAGGKWSARALVRALDDLGRAFDFDSAPDWVESLRDWIAITDELLRQYWSAIEAVAAILGAKGRIDRREVDATVRMYRPMKVEGWLRWFVRRDFGGSFSGQRRSRKTRLRVAA
jgi:hypothetical protein